MQSPRRWLGFLLLPALIGACENEGVIGQEQCIGADTRCDGHNYDGLFPDLSQIEQLGSTPTQELSIAWTVTPAPCTEENCWWGKLMGDQRGGLWFYQATSAGDRYYHIDHDGQIVDQGDILPPRDATFLADVPRVDALSQGGFVAGLTWSALDIESTEQPYYHEIVKVDEYGVTSIPAGRSAIERVPGLLAPARQFSVIPRDGGFVSFLFSTDTRIVRGLDERGTLIWQQVNLPAWARLNYGAVQLGTGFALLSGQQTTLLAMSDEEAGVLWFDTNGNQTGAVSLPVAGTQAPSATILGLADGRVAVAGIYQRADNLSNLQGWALDLYVMRLAKNGAAEGHRIVNESPLLPRTAGFAKDPDENLYVASVTGTRADPRGLLCVLPAQGEATCYLTPRGVFPNSIAVPSAGEIYALSGSDVVRLALPEAAP